MSPINFQITKKLKNKLGRAGVIKTLSGEINTPAFVTVGTKATVKSLTPEQVKELGAEVVLANTYHLYLQPGDKLVKEAGGVAKFMNWQGPTITDSGGFQVFSLGAAYGENITKITTDSNSEFEKRVDEDKGNNTQKIKPARVDDDGVTFKSNTDGSTHRFTPERSMEIQHNLGADIFFAFDECTSPLASYQYQREAMERTHRWAKRCLDYHQSNSQAVEKQALFGIVQGGRFEDLRKESAEKISGMDFSGFGVGGSFNKEDMDKAVSWVNKVLPEEKPRHLLGIGEPIDLFKAVENGADMFDCVAPTRNARNGTFYTAFGKINILNSKFSRDFSPLDEGCGCYACKHYSKAYLSHLFRAKEMLGATLGSIHNLYFIINLTKRIRQAILDDNFSSLRDDFLRKYSG